MKKIISLLVFSALCASCSKHEQNPPTADTAKIAATPVKQGQGKGLIRAIDTGMKTVTLAHNDIPGVMEAMTMEYPVKDSASLHTISVGDSVQFTLEDRGTGNFVVTAIVPMKK